jgi:hypothetical protein
MILPVGLKIEALLPCWRRCNMVHWGPKGRLSRLRSLAYKPRGLRPCAPVHSAVVEIDVETYLHSQLAKIAFKNRRFFFG